jgi:hypothetical protein
MCTDVAMTFSQEMHRYDTCFLTVREAEQD